MVHAASLLHDDVIDGGAVRRGQPALWVAKGIKGAILMGDLLVCQAISLLARVRDARLVPRLTAFAEEMCAAEVEQELLLPERPEWSACVSLARRKTGSLFAFAAEAASGGADPLRGALREAGYALGTAYQLADDMLDAYGDPLASDKTLGGDAAGGKLTAASAAVNGGDPVGCIQELCRAARASLGEWPAVQESVDQFVAEDMRPVTDAFLSAFRAAAVCEKRL